MLIERGPRPEDGFTILSTTLLRSPGLSAKALGVLVHLLSYWGDMHLTSEGIATHFPDGRDSIRTAMTELREAGYLHTRREQDEGGKWRTIQTLYSQPLTPEQAAALAVDNQAPPKTGFPASVSPASENPALIEVPVLEESSEKGGQVTHSLTSVEGPAPEIDVSDEDEENSPEYAPNQEPSQQLDWKDAWKEVLADVPQASWPRPTQAMRELWEEAHAAGWTTTRLREALDRAGHNYATIKGGAIVASLRAIVSTQQATPPPKRTIWEDPCPHSIPYGHRFATDPDSGQFTSLGGCSRCKQQREDDQALIDLVTAYPRLQPCAHGVICGAIIEHHESRGGCLDCYVAHHDECEDCTTRDQEPLLARLNRDAHTERRRSIHDAMAHA